MVFIPTEEDMEMANIPGNMFFISPPSEQGTLPKPVPGGHMYDHAALDQLKYGYQVLPVYYLPPYQKKSVYGRII